MKEATVSSSKTNRAGRNGNQTKIARLPPEIQWGQPIPGRRTKVLDIAAVIKTVLPAKGAKPDHGRQRILDHCRTAKNNGFDNIVVKVIECGAIVRSGSSTSTIYRFEQAKGHMLPCLGTRQLTADVFRERG